MTEGLRVEGLYTAYDRADVLEDVSVAVEPGSITCLLGSNGSGKTTLIRSILGLTPPRRGRVVFGDRDLTRLPTHGIVALGISRTCCSAHIWRPTRPSSASGWSACSRSFPGSPSGASSWPARCPEANRRWYPSAAG